MNSLYVLSHLGIGDHMLCNGLIRNLATKYGLIQIPCFLHNYESVHFMFKDLPNVQAVAIKDEADAIRLAQLNGSLRLGYYSLDSFNSDIFDQEFYRQAGVPFKERWDNFRIGCSVADAGWDHPDYAFVHDDRERTFGIEYSRIELPIVKPVKNGHIFNNLKLIRSAAEVHCINSSFLILVDSLPEVPGQKLFFHRYPRVTPYPMLKKKWHIYE